ncbi:Copper homeostasis cutC [Lecanosticta acicola]|uniref:Copper homeostasis protein cutC homolog n=1 Tax=Lecanosticta acicola TaxID=111012 RepID=A0AAI9E8H6_9PEZI|nr:Copper homeostasis cutC [Lecanosticta acicola]
MALLEIACFNPESAILADEAGADRIELCENQEAGGTAPPIEWLTVVKARVNIPVFVMIRPRGGDFVYSESEFESMIANIDKFKASADGFVFGLLDQYRRIDMDRTTRLVRQASPLPCTFHRAFDETPDASEALQAVIATGCAAILTSGGASTAHEGIEALRTLTQKAQGRITVIPGGGVRLQNLSHLRVATGASTFHSSALASGATIPDASDIRQMKRLLDNEVGDKSRE